MSNRTLAFIDPLEVHFADRGRPSAGQRFHLVSDSKKYTNSPKYTDQFKPYSNVFPNIEDGIAKKKFRGTLFRFPLRKKSSELSTKTFESKTKISHILDAFRDDADDVLLFLRSLENIEVQEKLSGQDLSRIVHVKAEEDRKSHMSNQITKEEFCSKLESRCLPGSEPQQIEMNKVITITCTRVGSAVTKRRWIISNFIACEKNFPNLSEGGKDQKCLPWMGVAIPIACRKDDGEAVSNACLGRVFCFLPLSRGEESTTGLPVHVHGFFAVNNNRRGIKWPGADQASAQAKWNEHLVRDILPSAYTLAIVFAINLHKHKKRVSTQDIYRAWPRQEHVKGNWNILLAPLFQKLFEKPVIYSDNTMKWMKISEVYFCRLPVENSITAAILKFLRKAEVPYATIPDVCIETIKTFCNCAVKTISPEAVCEYVDKNLHILEELEHDEKLLILEFILSDIQYSKLKTIPLLPLDDGRFETFDDSKEAVYISTKQFPRTLIPNAHQHFVKTMEDSSQLASYLKEIGMLSLSLSKNNSHFLFKN